jgi:hypothetical protein
LEVSFKSVTHLSEAVSVMVVFPTCAVKVEARREFLRCKGFGLKGDDDQ